MIEIVFWGGRRMEHKTIKGIGGEVHYWISQPKDTLKGTIVFTHGLTANHTMFKNQIKYFENEYIQFIQCFIESGFSSAINTGYYNIFFHQKRFLSSTFFCFF